jgi:hypothetical protein
MTQPKRALQVFKRVAAQAASALDVNFGTFLRDWGLGDFLIDEEPQSDVPEEIAARALSRLCSGRIDSRDQLVFLTVIQFLDETLGSPAEDPQRVQRLRDLAQIAQTLRTYDAFLKCAQAWYG